jgi:hypothetical protein
MHNYLSFYLTKETLSGNYWNFLHLQFNILYLFILGNFALMFQYIYNARFYYFVRLSIQGRVCLNITIRDF